MKKYSKKTWVKSPPQILCARFEHITIVLLLRIVDLNSKGAQP